jgi:staphyloferrin B biosynthesis citrate synthase
MLHTNALKQALRERQTVFGLFCSTPVPAAVKMIGCAGFDFVVIDTEHALVNPEALENMIRAAEVVGLTALVRVPDASAGTIARALDAGAQGVVIPRVHSRAEAEQAARLSRYYPDGERGLDAGRAAVFGKHDLQTYIQTANREVMVTLMIEDRHGVEALPEILSVPGIDLVLEGAADLSQSLGVPLADVPSARP